MERVVWPAGQQTGQGWGEGALVSQEGNAVGRPLAIWHQVALGITSTNPAVMSMLGYT